MSIGTYNVIEAAMKLGIRKVVIASSETTYGVCFAEGDKDFHSFRSKRTTTSTRWTATACPRSSTRRPRAPSPCAIGADIYALRIGNVIEPHEYDRFPGFLADPPSRKRNAWSYIDARDLGQIVHLCLEKDGLGFQVFNAVNDTITANEPTAAFLANGARDAGHARARAVRGAALEPQDPRGARLQGRAQLAEIRAGEIAIRARSAGSRTTPPSSAGRRSR